MKLTGISTTQIKKFFGGKMKWLWIFGILISCLLYCFFVDFYDKKFNPFENVIFCSEDFTFYSGRDGGMYHQIGSGVAAIDSNKNWFNKIFFNVSVVNKETNGGYENPLGVLTTDNSFGLVEDDIFSPDDVIRKQLNYVSPLYTERMHIVFRKTELLKNKEVSLSPNTNESTLKYLSDAKISTGPIGGGTKILASYIINELNNQIKEYNRNKVESQHIKIIGDNIVSYQISEGKTALVENRLDVMFLIAGAPLPIVDTLLKTNNFGLISIEPTFTSELNKKYKLDLRITDFKHISDKLDREPMYLNINSDKVATLGTYCYLITNNKTHPKYIQSVLEKLKKLEISNTKQLPLEEIKFIDVYQNSVPYRIWTIIRNFILLIATAIALSAVGVVPILVWGVSKYKHDAYVDTLSNISKYIPNNRLPENQFDKYIAFDKLTLAEKEEEKNQTKEYLLPDIKENQINIISMKIVPSIHRLIGIRDDLTQDFSDGVLTDDHYTFLMNRTDELMNKFRKSLFHRLNEMLERKNNDKPTYLILQKYCTAEYLNMEDFDTLKGKT